jgi:hypothetical protein
VEVVEGKWKKTITTFRRIFLNSLLKFPFVWNPVTRKSINFPCRSVWLEADSAHRWIWISTNFRRFCIVGHTHVTKGRMLWASGRQIYAPRRWDHSLTHSLARKRHTHPLALAISVCALYLLRLKALALCAPPRAHLINKGSSVSVIERQRRLLSAGGSLHKIMTPNPPCHRA